MAPTLLALHSVLAQVGLASLVAMGTAATQAQTRSDPLPGDYQVVEGRVDRGTYNGWQLFESHCRRCHGTGAVGTAAAPNLLERIPNLTPRAFASKVLTSYRLVRMTPENGSQDPDAEREALLEEVMRRERTARGQPLMPAWDSDVAVPPHVLDLYAYLSARVDGVVGPGRPKLIRVRKR